MQLSQILENSKLDRVDTEIIITEALKRDRSFIHAHPEYLLTPKATKHIKDRLERREKNEPLAYILGYKEFYGLRLFVDKHVLIPRHETEELVERVVTHANKYHNNKPIKICDVGTGSGCIAVSLAKSLPKSKIFATDVDPKALSVARKNAKLHSTEKRIIFLKGDLLSPLPEKVDVIVANLPYIKTQSIKNLAHQVSKWEPRIAIDGGVDGMKLYKKLFAKAAKYLNPDSRIFYELDGKTFSPE